MFTNGHRRTVNLRELAEEKNKLLLEEQHQPPPLHKTLVLLETLKKYADTRFIDHERLALASAAVRGISNLHFGPEVGVGPAKSGAPVLSLWLKNIRAMCDDLHELEKAAEMEAVVYMLKSNALPPPSKPAALRWEKLRDSSGFMRALPNSILVAWPGTWPNFARFFVRAHKSPASSVSKPPLFAS